MDLSARRTEQTFLSSFNELPPHERYRRATFTLAVVLCVFAAFSQSTGFADQPLTVSRTSLIVLLLGVAASITFSSWARAHAGALAMLASLGFLGHQAVAISVHGLNNELSLSLLVTLVATSVVMHTTTLLLANLCFWAVGILSISAFAPHSEINTVYFSLIFMVAGLFLYMVIGSTIRARKDQHTTDSVMRGLFDQSVDALLYVEFATDKVLGANARAKALCETDDLEVLKRIVQMAFVRAHAPLSPAEVQAKTSHLREWQGTVEFETDNGNHLWADMSMRRIDVDHQDVLLIRFTDVTQRMADESRLRRVDMLLEKAQSMARVAAWEFDLLKDEMYWTDTMYDMLGLNAAPSRRATCPSFLSAAKNSSACMTR